MGIDESEVSRLLRGDVPNDDPVWGEVSTFLDSVETAYPTVPTAAIEDRHLAAVAHETRLVHSELRRPRQSAVKRLFHGSHRVLAGSVGAFLIALTAGIGVASALGINPLGQLFAPHPVASSVVPPATSPRISSASADSNSGTGPGTTSPGFVPGSVPAITGLPTPTGLPSLSPGSGAPSDEAAAKASAKAEKAAEKARKDAEKAAEKAKNDAEKAAKEAEKNKAKATTSPKPPPPPPGPGKGKGRR